MNSNYRYDVFLSHNAADKGWVRHLAQQIEGDESGPPLRVFFDAWDVAAGSNIPPALSSAIDESRRIAFVLSPASVASEWVAFEVDLAIARRDPSGRKGVLVPLLRADCEIPPELSHLSYIDFRRQRYHDGLRRLIDLLRDRGPDRGPGSADSVRQFAEDCDLIAEHRNFFARPAFQRPLVLELSLSDLAVAVDDTVAALNTGAHYGRSGRLLTRTRPSGQYQTEQFVEAIGRVRDGLGELQRLLRDFREDLGRRVLGNANLDDAPAMMAAARATGSGAVVRETLAWMDRVDEARNAILHEINELLELAHERPFAMIQLSSAFGAPS
jgi:hypothetical protein